MDRLFSFLFLSFFLLEGCTHFSESNVEVRTQSVQKSRRTHQFDALPQEYTRPVVIGDILYFANLDGEVAAIHRTLGYQFWKRKLPAAVQGALSYGRSKIFVGDIQGNLYALNSRDGSVAWHFKINAEWLSPPTIHRDRVFVASSSDDVYCLSETRGTEIWHYSRRGDEKMTVRGIGSPTVFGGEVYLGFSDGFLVALSASQGQVFWAKRLRTRERFYDVDMTPWVDEDGVVAATFDGSLYHLDRLTGNVKWMINVGSYGGFLVEGSRIYLSGLNNAFYSVNKANGDVIWRTSFEHGVGLAPIRVGDYLVVATSSDPVYLLNPDTGKIVATTRVGTGSFAAPAAHLDGSFYILSNYGNLFSFQVAKRSPGKAGTLTAPKAFQQKIVQPT